MSPGRPWSSWSPCGSRAGRLDRARRAPRFLAQLVNSTPVESTISGRADAGERAPAAAVRPYREAGALQFTLVTVPKMSLVKRVVHRVPAVLLHQARRWPTSRAFGSSSPWVATWACSTAMVAVWNGWYRWPCGVHRNHSAVNMSRGHVSGAERHRRVRRERDTSCRRPPVRRSARGSPAAPARRNLDAVFPNSVATWLAECASGRMRCPGPLHHGDGTRPR